MFKKLTVFLLITALFLSLASLTSAAPAIYTYDCDPDFQSIYSKTEGVISGAMSVNDDKTANFDSSYPDFLANQYQIKNGEQEIVWKFNGPIGYYYIHYLISGYHAAANINQNHGGSLNPATSAGWAAAAQYIADYITLWASEDGVTYTELAEGTGSQKNPNTSIRYSSPFSSDSGIAMNDLGYEVGVGGRIINSTNMTSLNAGLTPLNPNVRYLKLKINNDNFGDDIIYVARSFFNYEPSQPVASIKYAERLPIGDYFDLYFDTPMLDSTVTAPGAVTVTGANVTSIEPRDGYYRVNLQYTVDPGDTYTVTLSPGIKGAGTGLEVVNKTLNIKVMTAYNSASNYTSWYTAAPNFPGISSHSTGVKYKEATGLLINPYHAYDVAMNGQEIVFKADGKINWFVFQLMYHGWRLTTAVGNDSILNNNWDNYIAISASKDGVNYTPLVKGVDYQYNPNTNIRTGANLGTQVAPQTDCNSTLYGIRITTNPNYTVGGQDVPTSLHEDVRYIKLTLTHTNSNPDTMYLFDCYLNTTLQEYTVADKKCTGTLENNGQIHASANYENNNLEAQDTALIFALYDGNNRLLAMDYMQENILPGTYAPLSASISLGVRDDNYEGCYVKAFIIDDFTNLKSLQSFWDFN